MDYRLLTVSLGLCVVVLPCSRGEDVSRAHGLSGDDTTRHLGKRSVLYSPADSGEDHVDDSDALTPSLAEDDPEKRGSIFRFGKRQGSLFRFGKRYGSQFSVGKRGSIFRFGKRQGSLFRFGKRSGSLFRFGRSGPADIPAENLEESKRTLFRFDKRSDLDLMLDSLARYRYLKSSNDLDDFDSSRGLDSLSLTNK